MKTISVNEVTHKELKSLCKTYQLTIVKLVQHSAHYFKQTGIDPTQAHPDSPQKAVRELTKRAEQIIGFIKTQEQEKINPMLEHLLMLCRRIELLLGDAPKESTFKTVLTRIETMIDEEKKQHVEQLKAQQQHYKLVIEALQKNTLDSNADTSKKLDEVMKKLDRMTGVN